MKTLAVPRFIPKLLASGFGAGYAPIAPGTAGAMVACLMLIILNGWLPEVFSTEWKFPHAPCYLLLVGTFFIVGVVASDLLEPIWGKDPSAIVIDEMVGMWISLLWVPFRWPYLLAGFVLFRVFDIWKPLGIRRIERWKGGWGVMMDDVLAGVYANIVLQLIVWYSRDFTS
jgi:phosphatidylglycerophosphatase A